MNCAECRDKLVACAEGLLDRQEGLQCEKHVNSCADCRREYDAIMSLQRRLTAQGQAAAGVNLVESVMQRVREEQFKPERETIMSKLLKYRWKFGLGAIASAAAVVCIILLSTPKAHAKAMEVMIKGAQAVANLTSVHLRGQLRTLPADNFSYINADCPFSTIELWKQTQPDLKWRVEKPGRVAIMDGASTVLYFKNANTGYKLPQRCESAFDTDWLHRIGNLSSTISNEMKNALAKGWQVSVAAETGSNGSSKSVVTVMATPGVPDNDYCKNCFLGNADTRRVYRFDDQSEMLEAVQLYLESTNGETLIFDLNQIDYNQPIDPSLLAIDLPTNVIWAQMETPTLANNAQYADMTAEQAASNFFIACASNDWEEAGKYMNPITDQLKQNLGGLEIVSLSNSFTSKNYPGRFVPYEIKLPLQTMNVRVSNTNSANRYVVTGVCDSKGQLEENVQWTNQPEALASNDPDAQLSPSGVVKAYWQAVANSDWVEMRKFTPQSDLEKTKAQVEQAKKAGMDLAKLLPVVEDVDAVWSAEQSAYLVKCHQTSPVKKWNLAVRKDNKAGRWQVDGGI